MLEVLKSERLEFEDNIRWNNIISLDSYSSYRQTFAYIKLQKNKGRKIDSFVFKKEGKDVAGAHYTILNSKFNILKVADILTGFIISDEIESTEDFTFLIEHFVEWAKINSASYIRINSWLPKTIGGLSNDRSERFKIALETLGFSSLVRVRHTYWINLNLSEEEILLKMKRQTRYEVRKAIKSSIIKEVITEPDTVLINEFWNLYKKLATTKGFKMYSEARLKNELEALLDSGSAKIILLKCNDKIINMSIFSTQGVGAYLHGAMNYEFKKLENCTSPGPMAQWAMITALKESGNRYYDMGFCPGSIPNIEHPAYNIWRFKYGFGGAHVEFLPTYGKAIKPIMGRIFKKIKY